MSVSAKLIAFISSRLRKLGFRNPELAAALSNFRATSRRRRKVSRSLNSTTELAEPRIVLSIQGLTDPLIHVLPSAGVDPDPSIVHPSRNGIAAVPSESEGPSDQTRWPEILPSAAKGELRFGALVTVFPELYHDRKVQGSDSVDPSIPWIAADMIGSSTHPGNPWITPDGSEIYPWYHDDSFGNDDALQNQSGTSVESGAPIAGAGAAELIETLPGISVRIGQSVEIPSTWVSESGIQYLPAGAWYEAVEIIEIASDYEMDLADSDREVPSTDAGPADIVTVSGRVSDSQMFQHALAESRSGSARYVRSEKLTTFTASAFARGFGSRILPVTRDLQGPGEIAFEVLQGLVRAESSRHVAGVKTGAVAFSSIALKLLSRSSRVTDPADLICAFLSSAESFDGMIWSNSVSSSGSSGVLQDSSLLGMMNANDSRLARVTLLAVPAAVRKQRAGELDNSRDRTAAGSSFSQRLLQLLRQYWKSIRSRHLADTAQSVLSQNDEIIPSEVRLAGELSGLTARQQLRYSLIVRGPPAPDLMSDPARVVRNDRADQLRRLRHSIAPRGPSPDSAALQHQVLYSVSGPQLSRSTVLPL